VPLPRVAVATSDVSIFGLGKIGYSLAACLGGAGNTVVGCDPLADVVDAINARRHNTAEPGVAERIAQLDQSRLRATTSPEDAVLNSDTSIVIVPTPSNVLGGFSLKYVLRVCEQIGAALRRKRGEHVISIASTVLPGASEHLVIPALEAASGRRVGDGLGYCYNPWFIALGESMRAQYCPRRIRSAHSANRARRGAIVCKCPSRNMPGLVGGPVTHAGVTVALDTGTSGAAFQPFRLETTHFAIEAEHRVAEAFPRGRLCAQITQDVGADNTCRPELVQLARTNPLEDGRTSEYDFLAAEVSRRSDESDGGDARPPG
jgi:hypothetical protein